MTAYVIPIIFISVVCLSLIKRKNPYNMYVEGASSAIDLMLSVFPYLLAIMAVVELFRSSGLSQLLANVASPVMNAIGIPPELTELMIIRPVSGAGSLSIVGDVYAKYGTDSYIGRCASVIYGSSETIFYIAAIYFSKSKVKNLRYAIPVALIATITGCILGCYLLRFF